MKGRDALHAATYLALAGVCSLLSVGLPAGGNWGGWMPDLMPVVLFYFLVHRPEQVLMGVVLLSGLFADLLYGRIPGTGALALLLAGEAARTGLGGTLSETVLGRAVLLAVYCTIHSTLLAAVDLPIGEFSLRGLLLQAFWAAVAYFPLALLLRHVFRVRAIQRRELVR